MICNRDCFNCVHKDCILDGITPEERKSLNERYTTPEHINPSVLSHRRASLAWYHKNKNTEDFKIKSKTYREANKDRLSQYNKEYHAEHREECNERTLSNYYANHEENKRKARERRKSSYHANIEESRRKQREYRARRKEREKCMQ